MDVNIESTSSRKIESHLYNIRIAWGYIEYIRKHYPHVDIDSILEYAGISPLEFKDPGYWYTQDQADRFGEICIEKTSNPDLPRESGRLVVNGDSFKSFRQFFLGFITPCAAYKGAEILTSKLNRGVSVKSRKLGKNRVELVCKPKEGVRDKPHQCKNRIGFIEGLCKAFTGKYARVEHTECIHKGGSCCRYIITWDNGFKYYLNRLRSWFSVALVSMCIGTFPFLSFHSWLELNLTFLVLVLGFFLFIKHRENSALIAQIENQAETAGLFLNEVDSRHDNTVLIQEIGTAISSSGSIAELLDSILSGLKIHMDVERAMILLISGDEPGKLEYAKGYGIAPDVQDSLRKRAYHFDVSTFTREDFSRVSPFTVHNPCDAPRGLGEFLDPVSRLSGISSFIVAPIVFRDEPTGFLVIDPDTSCRDLTKSDVNIIMGIAQQIAVSIHQARSFHRLQASERNYRLLVENANEGIVVTRNASCIYANPKITEITGFSEEELISKDALGFIHPDDRKIIGGPSGAAADRGTEKKHHRVRLIRKEGATRWAEINRLPVTWQGSEALLYFISDITEAKEARESLEGMNVHLEDMVEQRTRELMQRSEELLREADKLKRADAEKTELLKKLERSKKMESLGMLAGGVAHDLNNVLSGIVTYPELILLGLPEDSPMRDPIRLLRDSGQKAAAIVEDLLALAHKGPPSTTTLNINRDVVLEFLESPEYIRIRNSGVNIRVETDLDPHLHSIRGSLFHLKKTLANLFANAAEAQPEGGRIIVATRNRFLDSPLPGYDSVRKGNYAVLKVSDSGIGILPEDMDKIFEPFYTKKFLKRNGTGLSMTVVWNTVNDHQGYITVESAVGKGTTFTLYCPSTGEADREETRALTSVHDYAGSGETVLVVDDIEQQRKIASDILAELNYTVVTAASGEEAVEYLKSHSVDVVLLDMVMGPGMNGLETYRAIVRHRPGQKAVIASGVAENIQVEEAIRLGIARYIKKPYSISNLGETIKHVLMSGR